MVVNNDSLSDRTRIAMLADEAIVSGFELAGVNGQEEINPSTRGSFRYLQAISLETPAEDIVSYFRLFMERKEIALIFLSMRAAEILTEERSRTTNIYPIVMVIPAGTWQVSGGVGRSGGSGGTIKGNAGAVKGKIDTVKGKSV